MLLRWRRYLLVDADADYDPRRRRLYLLRDDFRNVICSVPWPRKRRR